MTKLTPSIAVIRHNLFTPSYDLVETWVDRPQTLDMAIIKKLEASTLAQQEKKAYLQSKTSEEDRKEEQIITELFTPRSSKKFHSQDVSIPDAIQQLIQQRSKAAMHTFSQYPSEGLIVLVGKGDGSVNDLGLAMASPLVVILDKESARKNIWNAWMVAKETNYATDWDMLLTSSNDAPLDPLAGMIQVWNPLQINTTLIEKTIGELKPERLAELRNLNSDYKRTLAVIGHSGITLEAIEQYQQMYSKVASFIDKKTMLTESPFERWKTALLSQAEKLGHCFTPIAIVDYAMGTESKDDKEKKWILDKHYEFQFTEQTIDGRPLIEISIKHINLGDSQFSIEYRENGFLANHSTLSKQSNKTEFICDPDNADIHTPTELIIKDSEGKELYRLDLSL
jgi:hypothetical protein